MDFTVGWSIPKLRTSEQGHHSKGKAFAPKTQHIRKMMVGSSLFDFPFELFPFQVTCYVGSTELTKQCRRSTEGILTENPTPLAKKRQYSLTDRSVAKIFWYILIYSLVYCSWFFGRWVGILLGGGNSNIFGNFHPGSLGKWSNLTSKFFEWVVQPPSRLVWEFLAPTL